MQKETLCDVAKQIAKILSSGLGIDGKATKRFLLATHTQPDGDAIGATFALGYIAKHFKKDIRLFFPEPIPQMYEWLAAPGQIVSDISLLGEWVPDVLIIADCGDERRPGSTLMPVFKGERQTGWENLISINIDHHMGNPEFADINWVEPSSAATGLLVGLIAEYLNVPLSDGLGEALYLALVTDTGNFSFSNTSKKAFELASRIVDAGLHVGTVTTKLENNWSLERMHLWGELMEGITLHGDGTIACCIASKKILDKYGCEKSDLEGFASWLRKIKGVLVAVFIREDAANLCKISLRSMGERDVRTVAAAFNGGGHTSAAGAEIKASPETAKELLLEKLFLG